MKKLTALILALVMVLSLCACGQEEQKNPVGDPTSAPTTVPTTGPTEAPTTEPTEEPTTEPLEPSEEEKGVLANYAMKQKILTENFNPYWHLYHQSYIKPHYEELLKIDYSVIDKWRDADFIDCEYLGVYPFAMGESWPNDIDWDYESFLSRFAVIPGAALTILCTTTDHLENIESEKRTDEQVLWNYYIDGKVASIVSDSELKQFTLSHRYDASGWGDDFCGKYGLYEYDEDGNLSKIKYYKDADLDDVERIRSFVYDESGKLIQEIIKSNYSESYYDYSYDDAGNLISITCELVNDEVREMVYTYDDEGQLIKEERNLKKRYELYGNEAIVEKEIMEYTYGDNGVRNSAVYTHQKWSSNGYGENNHPYHERVDHYTYDYDDQGRLLTVTVLPGKGYYCDEKRYGEVTSTPQYVQKVYEIIYGDYIAFDFMSNDEN